MAEFISPTKVASLARRHRTSAAGAPAKISYFWLLAGMVFHLLQASGVLSAHLKQLTGKKLSDSALSGRRKSIGLAFFQALLDQTLQGIAQAGIHSRAFYKGFLLTGIDGTTWSVGNTPPIKKSAKKTRSRRRTAAFFKLSTAAIYELGTHNPLAVRIGVNGESEMEMAMPLLSAFQTQWLLIADRYYGLAKVVFFLLSLPTLTHFLLRIRKNLKSKPLQRLRDGSCLVEIRHNETNKRVIIREIHAQVRRRSGQWVSIRLWTNLLDPKQHPARELVELYGLRWEQEIAYKELKIHLRRSSLLLSHTLVTAGQEVACLILAQALVARMRLDAAGDHTPILQISFLRTLDVFRSFWAISSLMADLLSSNDRPLLLRRLLHHLAQQASPPRRKRSCPRALRQPVSSWPRLIKNASIKGSFQFRIIRKAS